MSNKIFSTKKMEIKPSNWIKKSIIGTTILAVIGAFGFGVYQAASSESAPSTQRRGQQPSSSRQHESVPAFAHKTVGLKNKGKKTLASKQKAKNSKKYAAKTKKNSKKFANNKKRAKPYKADLSKLDKKSKKHLAKSKKSKRSAKQLAAK